MTKYIYKIFERVKELERSGKNIIKFNVGDPDQPTDASIVEAACNAIRDGRTKYGPAAGIMELREKIAESYLSQADRVYVSSGSKLSIFALIKTLARGGDIVTPSPDYPMFGMVTEDVGAKIKRVKSDIRNEWKLDIEGIKNAVGSKTKLIVLNSPNNPTSKALDKTEFKAVVDIAEDKGIHIMSDETYSDIAFDKVTSISDFDYEKGIMVNSFSKTFSMTGWRLGFCIMDKDLVNKMVEFTQMTTTCVPEFVQLAGITALENKKRISKSISDIYRRRLHTLTKAFSDTSLKFSEPDAPFYIFLDSGRDSEKLAFDLLEKGVAITPGTSFGDYRNFFRLAYTVPDSQIKEGARIVAEEFS